MGDNDTPNRIGSRPGNARLRPGTLHVSGTLAIAAVLSYVVLLVFLYLLTQQVNDLERRAAALELDNARLTRKLEILHVISDYQRGFSDAEVAEITNVIDSESDRYGIDPLLVLAVILAETDFKRYQVSDKGAMGLMQIRPYVGRDLALRRGITWNEDMGLFDPALNVKVGTTYLFELILEFNDLTHALAAYGHGETRLRRQLALGRPAPRTYTRRVMERYRKLIAEYREDGGDQG